MKIKLSHIAILSFLVVVVASCASGKISTHVRDIVSQLSCGMTPAEVENLARTQLEFASQRPWGNYMFTSGTTDIWLQFDEGQLRSVQTATLHRLMGMNVSPKKFLCS